MEGAQPPGCPGRNRINREVGLTPHCPSWQQTESLRDVPDVALFGCDMGHVLVAVVHGSRPWQQAGKCAESERLTRPRWSYDSDTVSERPVGDAEVERADRRVDLESHCRGGGAGRCHRHDRLWFFWPAT